MRKDCEVDPEKEKVQDQRNDDESSNSGQEVFRDAFLSNKVESCDPVDEMK